MAPETGGDYREDLDWSYLKRRATLPENDVLLELEGRSSR